MSLRADLLRKQGATFDGCADRTGVHSTEIAP